MYFFYARGIIGNASSFHDVPLSVLSFNLPTVHMSVSFFVSLANRLHPKNPSPVTSSGNFWKWFLLWYLTFYLKRMRLQRKPWWMQWFFTWTRHAHRSIDPHPFQNSHDPTPMHASNVDFRIAGCFPSRRKNILVPAVSSVYKLPHTWGYKAGDGNAWTKTGPEKN